MTFYGLSKLPFASPQRLQTLPKFQTPRARATAMRLFMNFKLPFASPQRLQTFQNKIPNTFPNRHPRAKATSPTGTPGPGPRPLPQQAPQGQATAMAFYALSTLPFASPQTLQNSPNAPKCMIMYRLSAKPFFSLRYPTNSQKD